LVVFGPNKNCNLFLFLIFKQITENVQAIRGKREETKLRITYKAIKIDTKTNMSLKWCSEADEKIAKFMSDSSHDVDFVMFELQNKNEMILSAAGKGGRAKVEQILSSGCENKVITGAFLALAVEKRGSVVSTRRKYIHLIWIGSSVGVMVKGRVNSMSGGFHGKFPTCFFYLQLIGDLRELEEKVLEKNLLGTGADRPSAYDFTNSSISSGTTTRRHSSTLTTVHKTSSIITNFIVWFHILSHGAIFVMDYTQVVPLLDFVKREDGTASDPNNLLPLELIYEGVVAMSFGTVAVGYLYAWLELGDLKFAAALSVWFHASWALHMWWRWEVWRSMMHKDAITQPEFFLVGHIVWAGLSLILLFMPLKQKQE
jgi:hypothetical protein